MAAPMSVRAAQKKTTRRLLLAAARDLMAEGQAVTVSAAAKRAGLSNATAYRYFSRPETLRIEAGLELDMGPDGQFLTLFEAEAAGVTDVCTRVLIAHRLMVTFVRRNLPQYRMFIAKGHEQEVLNQKGTKAGPRGGRRIPLLERAIDPVRSELGEERARDLLRALIAASGPDPDFVLRDVARLSDPEIDTVCAQNLTDIVQAHLARAGLVPR